MVEPVLCVQVPAEGLQAPGLQSLARGRTVGHRVTSWPPTWLAAAQAAVAVAFFADGSWRRHLPHDDTGEAKWVRARPGAPACRRAFLCLCATVVALLRVGAPFSACVQAWSRCALHTQQV